MNDSPNPQAVANILLRFYEWRDEQERKAEFPLSEEEVQALDTDRMENLHPLPIVSVETVPA